jgi:hypothetical protein
MLTTMESEGRGTGLNDERTAQETAGLEWELEDVGLQSTIAITVDYNLRLQSTLGYSARYCSTDPVTGLCVMCGQEILNGCETSHLRKAPRPTPDAFFQSSCCMHNSRYQGPAQLWGSIYRWHKFHRLLLPQRDLRGLCAADARKRKPAPPMKSRVRRRDTAEARSDRTQGR